MIHMMNQMKIYHGHSRQMIKWRQWLGLLLCCTTTLGCTVGCWFTTTTLDVACWVTVGGG